MSSRLTGIKCSATKVLSNYIRTHIFSVLPAACFPGAQHTRVQVVLRRVRRELNEKAKHPMLGTGSGQ